MSRRSRTLLLLCLAGLSLLLIYEVQGLLRFMASTGIHKDRDYPIFYEGAKRLLSDPSTLYEPGTAREMQGYTYPPLSVLLFLPFLPFRYATSYALFQLANFGALLLACRLLLRMRREMHPDAKAHWAYGACFTLLVVTSGPWVSGVALGQVSGLILVLCVGAVYLSWRDRPALAGLCLAFACWIKIYPTLLLLAMLGLRPHRRSALAATAFGVLLPVSLLWLIPLDVYGYYFLRLLPYFAGHITIYTDNQSIAASLVRLGYPLESWTTWRLTTIHPWIRAVNTVLLLGSIAFFASKRVRRSGRPLLVSLLALSLMPLIAPLGWGHSFLFAVPLVAWCAVYSRSAAGSGAAALSWLLLLMPGYSNPRILEHAPAVLRAAFFFRYPAAVVIAIVMAARHLLSPPMTIALDEPLPQRVRATTDEVPAGASSGGPPPGGA